MSAFVTISTTVTVTVTAVAVTVTISSLLLCRTLGDNVLSGGGIWWCKLDDV